MSILIDSMFFNEKNARWVNSQTSTPWIPLEYVRRLINIHINRSSFDWNMQINFEIKSIKIL